MAELYEIWWNCRGNDLEGAMAKQNLMFQPGDHHPHRMGKLWDSDGARFVQIELVIKQEQVYHIISSISPRNIAAPKHGIVIFRRKTRAKQRRGSLLI